MVGTETGTLGEHTVERHRSGLAPTSTAAPSCVKADLDRFITDEPYQLYLGRRGRKEVPLENAIYGRWATLGLRYDY